MRSAWAFLAVAAGSAVLLLLGHMPAASTEILREDRAAEIELLANDLHISEEKALKWFSGEEEFLSAVSYALAVAPDQYSNSAWTPELEESLGYKAWVAFKGNVPSAVSDRFKQLPFSVDLRFDATHSENELEEIRYELMSDLHETFHFEGLAGSITEAGGIELEYEIAETEAEGANIDSAISELVEDSPVEVVMVEREDIEPVEEVVRGGVGINECTTGFPVTKGSLRGVLTAGHCPDRAGKPSGSSVTLTFRGQHEGASGDIQWHSTTDSLSNHIRVSRSGHTRAITSYGAAVNGTSVCNYGKTRSTFSCTTIRNANHAFYSGSKYLSNMVQTNGSFTNFGDSGGPWFAGNSARGIHFGKSGGFSTYTKITSALPKFGLRLKNS